jgi:hypothetical protein
MSQEIEQTDTEHKNFFKSRRKKRWHEPNVVLVGTSLRDGHLCRDYTSVTGTRLGSINGDGAQS